MTADKPKQRRAPRHYTVAQKLAFFSRPDPNGCRLWIASKHIFGYGQLNIGNGKIIAAHRLAWIAANGPIPSGMHVCHHCDTPACIEPTHLFLGTAADNLADMTAKGRRSQGETHKASLRRGEAWRHVRAP